MSNDVRETWKQLAGHTAAELVENGMVIGLGTGTTAIQFVRALGLRVQAGLRLTGAVPTSHAILDLATSLNIPITDLNTHPELDLYVDGADEIDPYLRLIKGHGGALLREKIVASTAHHFVVIADTSKQVAQLGQNFPVPVEVVPFAVTPVRKRLEVLGAVASLRQFADNTFITENNNVILDCAFPNGIADPAELDARIHSIIGVVETGLFLNMASQAIIGGPEGVKTLP